MSVQKESCCEVSRVQHINFQSHKGPGFLKAYEALLSIGVKVQDTLYGGQQKQNGIMVLVNVTELPVPECKQLSLWCTTLNICTCSYKKNKAVLSTVTETVSIWWDK